MKTEQEILERLDTLDVYSWQERNRSWRNHSCAEDAHRIYLHLAGVRPLFAEGLESAIDRLPPILLKGYEDTL